MFLYVKDCPNDVIRFLVKQHPAVLEHLFLVEDEMNNDNASSLPLHYYLSRNMNVDISTVKMMVETYPQSLMIAREVEEEYIVYPIHSLVYNEHITPNDLLEIMEYLLEYNPTSLHVLDEDNATLLHHVCYNKYVTLELVQLLYNSWPEAIRMRASHGGLPIHDLSYNRRLGDTAATAILRFMLDTDQSMVRERDGDGYLPIHYAVGSKSFEFCKVLINAYPESLRVGTNDGSLPIHEACCYGGKGDQVKTIQYMLDLYPESINVNRSGYLPIHYAAMYGKSKDIELLLEHDPDAASKRTTNSKCQLPLHIVCQHGDEEYLDTVKVLYDAYPRAIHIHDGDNSDRYDQRRTPLDHAIKGHKTSIVKLLQDQQIHVGKTPSRLTARMEIDDNGWTRLHHALKDNPLLGTIKLLAWVSPPIIRMADNQFAFPLHIACEVSSEKVVRYLVGESNKHILGHLDENKDSILHYACRGGNLEVVKYLLGNHSSLVASVEANRKGKLPIHLLCEAGKDKVDCDSVEYTETIWLMLLSNPEAVVGA